MNKFFDILAFLLGKAAGGGGGGDITVESKSINANGTYTAPAGKAYSPVTVHVQNSYAAGDEGKVVSNGQLVAQGSDTATQNGTVDTTLINSLEVNVPAGTSYTKLAEQDFTVSTSSTSAADVGTIVCGAALRTSGKIIYVRIRDKAGPRTGYFYGTDNFIWDAHPSYSGSSIVTVRPFYGTASGVEVGPEGAYGVFVLQTSLTGDSAAVKIQSRYNANTKTVDGIFHVEVYLLDWPDGVSPFAT